MIRFLIAALAGVVGSAILLATASAARPQPIPLDCGDAGSFQILVSGNGPWTPGRIVGGGVVHPVAFTNQHSEFTDNQGHTFTQDDPDVFRTNIPANKELVHCSFSGNFQDANGSGTFSGEVDGYIVGLK